MSTPPEKPPRKFPAPCWTQDETLALIDAYRDRWYALRRGYLRTADWDTVAAAVTARCPDASPAKTSAQCRHKMEKLRQRYRAEKQRSLSFPGRFFSSWFFFENMDSMAVGSSAADGDKVDAKPNPDLGLDHELGAKSLVGQRSVTLGLRARNSSPNLGSRVLNGYSPYLDHGSDEDVGEDNQFGGGFSVRAPVDEKFVLPPVYRTKKVERMDRNFGPNFDSNHDEGGFIDVIGGYGVKNPRQKKFDSGDGGFFVKISGERFAVPKGVRTKNSGKADGNSFSNYPDSRFMNGFSPSLGVGVVKKSGGGGGGGGGRGDKRERDPIAEMVSSIKLLGEGFVKMEKMKMEMAREIEKMRMEMDMKRNELILESQRQIVDAFVNVLMEKKKKQRASTPVLPDS